MESRRKFFGEQRRSGSNNRAGRHCFDQLDHLRQPLGRAYGESHLGGGESTELGLTSAICTDPHIAAQYFILSLPTRLDVAIAANIRREAYIHPPTPWLL
ncbi:predicted protein [Plenodomus lingam JN3]|uniref:Predicted protein n=1 Tax=Leptosphaeria maculans (strain JN3 / isolate v23.1.3 / race Av1-4-5-6-7-8) TaxID=985895 RepID=E5AB16_LEPMJ|nr:predicted protein [Plenodomus lingam JN3]CBY00857.1 predicted protein [Plenodomus lingam JN3]